MAQPFAANITAMPSVPASNSRDRITWDGKRFIRSKQPQHFQPRPIIAAIGIAASDYGNFARHRFSDAPEPARPFRFDRQIQLRQRAMSGGG